jgi:glucose-6-phosphate 1-dehydrogenase
MSAPNGERPKAAQASRPEERKAPPCTFVIFGASGDLTRRKLIPALYNLAKDGGLPSAFATLGVARREKTDESFRDELREALTKYSRQKPIDDAVWTSLAEGIGYVRGTFENPQTYADLKERLERCDQERGTQGSRIFYLAVGPEEMIPIVKGLAEVGLLVEGDGEGEAKNKRFARLIVEKPFGEDLESAHALNKELFQHVGESQIYRIDHYLGKETVQNMMVLRFENSMFEAVWNRNNVSHVEITVAEDIGIEGRGKFYEKVGITRDIVQNHLLQLLTIVAMEPPVGLDADAVRDEKVKVLRSLRPITGEAVATEVVRAQYVSGTVNGQRVPAYRDEPDVAEDSENETYAAFRVHVDNWRWSGVPFFLRAGKRLSERLAEVCVHFRAAPFALFPDAQGRSPNCLVVRVQPDEGISFHFDAKVPGQGQKLREVSMDFRYGAAFGSGGPEAYERLILDAMRGDATLFTRHDEVEAQWRFIDPIRKAWAEGQGALAIYRAGTDGPVEANHLPAAIGEQFRPIVLPAVDNGQTSKKGSP